MKNKELFKLKAFDTRYDMLHELMKFCIDGLNSTCTVKSGDYEGDEIMEILETFLKDCQVARELKVEECR